MERVDVLADQYTHLDRLANIVDGYTHSSRTTEYAARRISVRVAIEVDNFIRRRVAEEEVVVSEVGFPDSRTDRLDPVLHALGGRSRSQSARRYQARLVATANLCSRTD
jgi:hypothetical protein